MHQVVSVYIYYFIPEEAREITRNYLKKHIVHV